MRAGAVVFWVLLAACAGKSNSAGRGGTGSGGDGSGGATGGASSGGSGGATGGASSGGKGGKGGTGGDGGDGMSTGGSDPAGGSDATGGTASGGDGSMSGGTGGDGMSTGGSDPGTAGTPSAMGGSAGVEDPPITSCTDSFGFLGTWEGNVLDFFFEPIQTVRLVLSEDPESGVISGTMTYGEGDPPPPPESADIPYPPGFWDDPFNTRGGGEPWPGFPYTVVRGAGCDTTLRLGFSSAEIFHDWCAMMEPVYTPEYGWGCTLQGGGSGNQDSCTVTTNEGETAMYPMWKCSACGFFGQRVCACDEAGCFSDLNPDHIIDLALVAGSDATLSGPDATCGDCTVRLERVD